MIDGYTSAALGGHDSKQDAGHCLADNPEDGADNPEDGVMLL